MLPYWLSITDASQGGAETLVSFLAVFATVSILILICGGGRS